MRLAPSRHFFANVKEDPRLTNGTRERPKREESEEAKDRESRESPSCEEPDSVELDNYYERRTMFESGQNVHMSLKSA
ncbi:hypothetical protein TRAPUB_7601 [Trametes pubescens]|uniref:Uncharacterized protein n=1 Tax=Trametes pubescens TaxID=154538 RepID=A0A1M2V334_TRAPU|nr:hypothetical protein TRAPUB_7601 [Trametes pubescens]